jgi:hypothetical protein
VRELSQLINAGRLRDRQVRRSLILFEASLGLFFDKSLELLSVKQGDTNLEDALDATYTAACTKGAL